MRIYQLLLSAILLSLILTGANSLTSCVKANPTSNKVTQYNFLALGDSYTIGEKVKKKESWPFILNDLLAPQKITLSPTKIIAKTGWRTDQMLASAKNQIGDQKYDLVSLSIGVNNEFQGESPEAFIPKFKLCLDYAIAHCKAGKENVFVVSIPDYGYTNYGENNQASISARIDEYNAICQTTCENFGVTYFNITPISRNGLTDPNLIASDGLHPSAQQYELWVESFYEQVAELLLN